MKTATPLRIEVGAVYLTPTGRRCYWRPNKPSDEPQRALQFEYLGGDRLDGFEMTPQLAQRLLRREGPR